MPYSPPWYTDGEGPCTDGVLSRISIRSGAQPETKAASSGPWLARNWLAQITLAWISGGRRRDGSDAHPTKLRSPGHLLSSLAFAHPTVFFCLLAPSYSFLQGSGGASPRRMLPDPGQGRLIQHVTSKLEEEAQGRLQVGIREGHFQAVLQSLFQMRPHFFCLQTSIDSWPVS